MDTNVSLKQSFGVEFPTLYVQSGNYKYLICTNVAISGILKFFYESTQMNDEINS